MRIGLIADTHDRLARTRTAVDMLRTEGAEAFIHCGDLTGPDILIACAVLPCYFVFGNNDSDSVPYLRQTAGQTGAVCLGWGGVIELDGKRIGVVHGHLTSDLRRVLADRPDYVLSGHSHIPDDRRDGPIRRINPGALHRATAYSVAMLDLATDDLRFFQVVR